jgi:hypothetical protein
MKTYTITRKRTNRDNSTSTTGTLEFLNMRYGKNAKSIKTLVNLIQTDYADREAACYERTIISVT